MSLTLDKDDIYDHREKVFARLDQAELEEFEAKSADPVLGWDNFGPRTKEKDACTGSKVTVTIDPRGARSYAGYDRDEVQVVVVGDSFTHGSEANDADAYPAQLATLLGVSVANHGVGGYGPVQALLNLEQKLPQYPMARVVVLGIMYENIFRMVNSYRPVLTPRTGNRYGSKPYMKGGRVIPNPGARALADIKSFKEYADQAFDQDFWAKPVYGFPYSWALAKSLASNYFSYIRLQKKGARKIGLPDYMFAYRSENFLSELFPLLQRFTDFSSAHGIVPVVIFIPANPYDTKSASMMIQQQRNRFPENLLVGDVGEMELDWTKFNLRNPDNNDYCHPSSYGYRKIAEYVANLLENGGPL